MKSSFLALAAGLLSLLSACTPAQTYYKPHHVSPDAPWQGAFPGWGGYRTEELGSNQLRVTFTNYNHPPMDFARTFAYARASELALQRGYDHFKVDRQSPRTSQEKSVFPAWVEPGYVTEDVYRSEYRDFGRIHVEETIVVNEVPPQLHPARTVQNQVHVFQMDFSLVRQPGPGTVQAYLFLKSLESKSNPWGKPPLDPATKAAIRAYEARLARLPSAA
ncbi:MAG: hypothetical protein AAF555_08115 [Verrucomicrobiota bacterium]